MNPLSPVIPSNVRRNVATWFGAAGHSWLETVPQIVCRLVDEWRLAIHSPLEGGSASLVLTVTQQDSTPAVLKIPFLDDENRHEADALRHYGGVGAVQLYQSDRQSGALLLERLLPGTGLDMLPDPDRAISIATQLLRRLWRPPSPGHPFRHVRDLALEWADELPAKNDRYGSPLPYRLVQEAAALARNLARSEGDDVVVNRDAHLANILSAEREPWLLIDPKPLVGDRSFDGGYLLLDRLEQAPTSRAVDIMLRKLAEGLGVDRERLRSWALLRAIENALWALDVNAPLAVTSRKQMPS